MVWLDPFSEYHTNGRGGLYNTQALLMQEKLIGIPHLPPTPNGPERMGGAVIPNTIGPVCWHLSQALMISEH